jgi:hypothetical protein
MSILSQTDRDEIAALCPRLYAAVGWGPDQAPDWETFRACCHSQAILTPMGSGAASPIPLETFIAGMDGQRTSGAVAALSEEEIGHSVEGYGNLASVRSSFIATIDGAARRGVTFAHIVRDEGRWAILAAIWENERDDAPLPAALV